VSTIAKLSDREEMPQQTWFKHFIQQHCVKPYSIVIQHTDFYLSCYCEFYATATQILFSTVSCKSARCGVICWVAPEYLHFLAIMGNMTFATTVEACDD
jgi:hypothetical protein